MSAPRYRPVSNVGWVTETLTEFKHEPVDRVHIAVLPDGPCAVLEGSAAHAWHAMLDPAAEDLVEDVADRFGANPASIRSDVEHFLEDLLRMGIIEAVPRTPPGR